MRSCVWWCLIHIKVTWNHTHLLLIEFIRAHLNVLTCPNWSHVPTETPECAWMSLFPAQLYTLSAPRLFHVFLFSTVQKSRAILHRFKQVKEKRNRCRVCTVQTSSWHFNTNICEFSSLHFQNRLVTLGLTQLRGVIIISHHCGRSNIKPTWASMEGTVTHKHVCVSSVTGAYHIHRGDERQKHVILV